MSGPRPPREGEDQLGGLEGPPAAVAWCLGCSHLLGGRLNMAASGLTGAALGTAIGVIQLSGQQMGCLVRHEV